ncbi:Mob1/phocein, partial [Aureobasidium melanogenum]
LHQIDSAFQLTEHLKALHNEHTQSCRIAIDKATAQSLAQPPPGVDRGIWLYELCRFLTQKANMMACGLFADDPPCSAATCPEMRASEWQYLCAAHEPPKSCCAIDYCCHTLDWCATALTSTKLFPSRLGLGTETLSAQAQIRKMTEVFRRVYRIFAHAWFSHRDVFWRVESKTGLYLLFKTVCDEYRLIPEDNYTIPPEAEGIETTP